MKILITFLLLSSVALGQTTKKVCFLGNSYTYFNDLPGIISALAAADGNTLVKDQNTPGGYTFEGHSTNSTSLSKISSDTWDFVVLQEQSQLPSFPWSQASTDCFPYAKILVDSIRSANACAVPLFFNTWGRLNGDPQWDSINTFDKMNQRLSTAYGYMADHNSGMRAPIGIGFDHVDNDLGAPITLANLYNGDGSHPSIYGSYLAACIFYEIIFEASAQGNTHIPSGITGSQATYIQNVANHVLNNVDSIDIDFTIPKANFSYSSNGLEVTFINQSEHSFEWDWQFSDGSSSTEEHPVHLFTQSSSFYATLTSSYCGKSSDTTIYIQFPLGINENNIDNFDIYPNPAKNEIVIRSEQENTKAVLYDMSGRIIQFLDPNQKQDLFVEPGNYIIQLGTLRKVLVVL